MLRPRRAHRRHAAELVGRIVAVPDLPAVLRADVLRGRGQRARPRLRQGVQRLDGRGVVRAVRRLQHPAVPHAAVGRRARGPGDPAQRGPGRARVLLQRAAPPPEAADDPQRRVGPRVPGLQRHRRHAVHAHRFVVDEPVRVTRRARRRRRHARVQQLDGVARRLAVLREADPVPRSSSSRTPRVRSAGSRTRSNGPTRCGTSTTAGSTRRS